MPQDEEHTSQDYAKGVNQMSFIARHDPELAKHLMSAKGMKGDRFEGMQAGVKQAKEEQKAQKKEKLVAQQKAVAEKAKSKQKTK